MKTSHSVTALLPVDAWSVAFSPDSKHIATGSHLGKVNIFGVESGKKEFSLDTRGKFILSIAYVSNRTHSREPCAKMKFGSVKLHDEENHLLRTSAVSHWDPQSVLLFLSVLRALMESIWRAAPSMESSTSLTSLLGSCCTRWKVKPADTEVEVLVRECVCDCLLSCRSRYAHQVAHLLPRLSAAGHSLRRRLHKDL